MPAPRPLPGVPEAKGHPTLRRYPLRRARLPVGNTSLSLVVPDERAWKREGSWAPSVVRGAEPPYWVRIWPAALAAARAIAAAGALDGLRVLDLGCGLGVPGVQAAGAGAAVTFADQSSDALAFARWNAAAQPGADTETVGVTLDWARAVVPGAFDLLVLSDVSYHAQHHRPLLRHLSECLAPKGVVLHADPHRDAASAFLSACRAGFEAHSWTRPTMVQDRRADVRLTLMAQTGDDLRAWGARCGAPVNGGRK